MSQLYFTANNTAWGWSGGITINYTASFDSKTKQTTVTFSQSFYKYFGRSGKWSEATTDITITATDSGNSATANLYYAGNTTGGNSTFYCTPNPTTITVQHNSTSGEKSITIAGSATIKAVMASNQTAQQKATGSGSQTEVVGSVEEGIVYLSNGSSFDPYQIFISNGSSFDQYVAYISNGIKWVPYGITTYTNLMSKAVNTSGASLNGAFWYTNYRFNSSSGNPIANTGTMITGLIPITPANATIRIRWSGGSSTTTQQMKYYKSDFTQVKPGYISFSTLKTDANAGKYYSVSQYDLANGKLDFTITDPSNGLITTSAAYVAFVLQETDAKNVVITINEEID